MLFPEGHLGPRELQAALARQQERSPMGDLHVQHTHEGTVRFAATDAHRACL